MFGCINGLKSTRPLIYRHGRAGGHLRQIFLGKFIGSTPQRVLTVAWMAAFAAMTERVVCPLLGNLTALAVRAA
jgi:hypothetical protein